MDFVPCDCIYIIKLVHKKLQGRLWGSLLPLVSSFVSYTSLYTTIHQNKGKYQVVPWVNLDHNIDTVHTAPAGCIQIKGKRIHNNIPCNTSLLYLGSKLSNHFMSQKVEQFDTQQYPFREKKNVRQSLTWLWLSLHVPHHHSNCCGISEKNIHAILTCYSGVVNASCSPHLI